jgi:hypothetical protein
MIKLAILLLSLFFALIITTLVVDASFNVEINYQLSESASSTVVTQCNIQYNTSESVSSTVMFNIRQLYTIVETVFNENLKLNELISFNYLITELTEIGSIIESSTPIAAYFILIIGFAVGIIFVVVGLRDLGVQI